MVGLRPRYEMIGFFPVRGYRIHARDVSDIWPEKWSAQKPHGHPAEKPAKLIERILTVSCAETVLDPFMGSGTTGVAALRQGRKFVGIEMNEHWYNVACERLQKTVSEGAI